MTNNRKWSVEDISQCSHCLCMTKTICGKCHGIKATPDDTAPRLAEALEEVRAHMFNARELNKPPHQWAIDKAEAALAAYRGMTFAERKDER